jgi:hypothetical protein
MKSASAWWLALLLTGCATPQANAPLAERQQQYLAELPKVRQRPWGPCESTFHFLADTGAAGVPTVVQALDTFGGPTNVLMRALIVDGAQHYSQGTNLVVRPIMDRALCDSAADVQAVAQHWLDKQQKK